MGIQSIPTQFLLSRNGAVLGQWKGEAHDQEIEAAIISAVSEL